MVGHGEQSNVTRSELLISLVLACAVPFLVIRGLELYEAGAAAADTRSKLAARVAPSLP